ncbi:MAG TPA: Calx-beta domain-containing protein, partial [Candidatus Acidoferrum sp.]|nr:Calx-beta domain-containing protein [Candidatus Acidoferrum sp.]
PFTPSSRDYTLQASAALSWSVSNIPPWLTFSRTNGTLASGAFTNLTAAVNVNATALTGGVYNATVYMVNHTSGTNVARLVTLRVGSDDYLTEDFSTHAFDLQNSVLTLSPIGNGYSACIASATNFPTDPATGIEIETMRDDEYRQVFLTGGKTITMFGQCTNALWIGANGNVTFDPGGNTNAFYPGTFEYFSVARIAPLYIDLGPHQGGRVSWQQLSNRVVVTYENVPEYEKVNSNSFQIELFYEGHVRITWLTVEAEGALAGISRGTGIPDDFAPSDLSALSGCALSGRIVIPLSAREGQAVPDGTILLSAPTPTNLTVALSTASTNQMRVTNEVTVLAGNSSVSFKIAVIDDTALEGTHNATIVATFPDRPPAAATMAIIDNETTRITVSIPPDTTEGAGLLQGQGLVLLEDFVGVDVAVQLASSNTARVAVPPSVIVLAGSRTAYFDLTVLDDNVLNGVIEHVTIAASVENWQYDKDVITVQDNDSYQLAITLVPQLSENGGSVQNAGTVSLSAPSLVPVTVSLNSDPSVTVFPPPSLVIPAGARSNSFTLFVVNNLDTNSFDVVKVIASSPNFQSATGLVTVLDDERPTPPFGPFPWNGATLVPPDVMLGWTVNPLPQFGTIMFDVYLSTNPNPTTLIGTTLSLGLPLGTQLESGQTYFWKVVARREPFAKESAVWNFTTAPFDHFSFATIPSTQTVGEPFPVTVFARDQYEKVVLNYRGTATLTNFAPVKPANKVVITEVDSGDSDRIEFQNISDQNVNIAGWQVTLYDAASWPAPKITYTMPAPSVAKAGDVFWLRAFAARFAPGTYPNLIVGTNLFWNSNPGGNPIAVLLRDNVGKIIDFFCAVDAFPSEIVAPVSIPATEWIGAPLGANLTPGFTYQRQGNLDRNIPGDWTYLASGILITNTGLIAPFTNYVFANMIAPPFANFVSGVCTGSVVVLDEARGMYFEAIDQQGHAGSGNRFDVLAFNDISLRASGPDSVTVNEAFAISFSITNSGVLDATGVVLSNALPAACEFVSATSSQGACLISEGAALCDLGAIAGGASATVTVTIRTTAPLAITNVATVVRNESDNYLPNNSAITIITAGLPQIMVSDAAVSEPLGPGASIMNFTVRLTAANAVAVTVPFATANGTATAGMDYTATNGVLIFPPGTTNQVIPVNVFPDTLSESNETFFLNLSGAANAQVIDDQGLGTINDNDNNPFLSITDVLAPEGPDGTNNVTFSLTLSAPSGKQISVGYQTMDGTALAGLDYIPTYGTLTFAPGEMSGTINVGVIGHSFFKANRTFYMALVSPSQVSLVRTQGVCTVIDKDTNRVHHLAFEVVPAKAYVDVPFAITGTARDAAGNLATDFTGPVHLLATENEVNLTVGSNSLSWEFPLGSGFHDSRLQAIYWAAELGLAGDITSLSLDVTNMPGATLNNFTIRTKAFAPSQFPNIAWETDGWITNFQGDVTIISTGWVAFPFRTPYAFDGITNLLVDYSFNNSSYGADGICRATVVPGLRAIGFRTDGAFGDPLSWSNASPTPALFNRIPNTRFSIGR